jgi:hypothetical protein
LGFVFILNSFLITKHEELHNLYSSPNIIRMIKSRRMKGRACSKHGRKEKCIQDNGGEARRKETTRKTKT